MANAFGSPLCFGADIASFDTNHFSLPPKRGTPLEFRHMGGEILSREWLSLMSYRPPVDVAWAFGYAEPATLHLGTAG
jgi:hypothetical protein